MSRVSLPSSSPSLSPVSSFLRRRRSRLLLGRLSRDADTLAQRGDLRAEALYLRGEVLHVCGKRLRERRGRGGRDGGIDLCPCRRLIGSGRGGGLVPRLGVGVVLVVEVVLHPERHDEHASLRTRRGEGTGALRGEMAFARARRGACTRKREEPTTRGDAARFGVRLARRASSGAEDGAVAITSRFLRDARRGTRRRIARAAKDAPSHV